MDINLVNTAHSKLADPEAPDVDLTRENARPKDFSHKSRGAPVISPGLDKGSAIKMLKKSPENICANKLPVETVDRVGTTILRNLFQASEIVRKRMSLAVLPPKIGESYTPYQKREKAS